MFIPDDKFDLSQILCLNRQVNYEQTNIIKRKTRKKTSC